MLSQDHVVQLINKYISYLYKHTVSLLIMGWCMHNNTFI